eukprot:3934408-Rhodomonas_salina.1
MDSTLSVAESEQICERSSLLHGAAAAGLELRTSLHSRHPGSWSDCGVSGTSELAHDVEASYVQSCNAVRPVDCARLAQARFTKLCFAACRLHVPHGISPSQARFLVRQKSHALGGLPPRSRCIVLLVNPANLLKGTGDIRRTGTHVYLHQRGTTQYKKNKTQLSDVVQISSMQQTVLYTAGNYEVGTKQYWRKFTTQVQLVFGWKLDSV